MERSVRAIIFLQVVKFSLRRRKPPIVLPRMRRIRQLPSAMTAAFERPDQQLDGDFRFEQDRGASVLFNMDRTE